MRSAWAAWVMVLGAALSASCGSRGDAALGRIGGGASSQAGAATGGRPVGTAGATSGVPNRGGAGGNVPFEAGVIIAGGAGGTAGAAGAGLDAGIVTGGSGGTSGAGGAARAGGSGGASGAAGAGGAITTTDAGVIDGGVLSSVRCGNSICETPAETCRVGYAAPSASCVTRAPVLCTGGCFIDECDGSEDCPTGQVCHFTVGEDFYFWCQDARAGHGTLCTTSADCPTAFSTCRELTEVGNYVAALGYQPRICDN